MLHLEDGRWAAIEIKLGGDELIEYGANSLKVLRSKIAEKSEERAMAFLMVLTAVGGAYQREDGVYVTPINMLKPLQDASMTTRKSAEHRDNVFVFISVLVLCSCSQSYRFSSSRQTFLRPFHITSVETSQKRHHSTKTTQEQ